MRPSWVAVLGFSIFAAQNGLIEAYQPRAVFARASSQPSSISDIAAEPTKTPSGTGRTVSNSRHPSADATAASSAVGSLTSSASSAAVVQTSSTLPTDGLSTSTRASSSAVLAKATPSSSQTSAASSETSNARLNALPITPTITPALSVAGALMMLTGLSYTLIGIKTKWLHIFLSTTYLVSLSVTVLIVYVMHPPVSNAVQGAFFVAAFATGLLFGGGSMIFADLAEGLAFLLGGFCLSMWFLVLRPDGLIRSTIGKAIFIVCFTLGAYAFYVSHHTRPYGLIGSISFAGATIVVLGIDCFSRAGLKEFWLYLWNLNDAILPPHYYGPYPITRGIRVEIAAIVLLCLIGIMSQLKVWKIVKKHRDRKSAARMDEEKRQGLAELDIGRELESGNVKERAAWERAYGGQSKGKVHQVDSGFSTGTTVTPRRASTSVREAETAGSSDSKVAENGEKKTQQSPRVTVRVASEDSIYEMPSATVENLLASGSENHSQSAPGPSIETSGETPLEPPSDVSTPEMESPQEETLLDASFGPPIVPLPFTVSCGDYQHMDDRSSIATFAASESFPNRISKRFSGSSLARRFTMRSTRRSMVPTTAEGESMIYDDGRASSVVATFDIGDDLDSEGGVLDLEQQTPPLEDADKDPSIEPLIPVISLPLTSENLNLGHQQPRGPADNTNPASPSAKDDGNESPAHEPSGAQPESRRASTSQKGIDANSVAGTETSQEIVAPTSFHDLLPNGASKVVMTYRTNEWAKHLAQADAPPPETLRKPYRSTASAPIMTEGAAPVDVKQLTQTPLTAAPAHMKINTNLNRSASSSRDSLPSQQFYQPTLPPNSSLRRSSQATPVNRRPSQNSLHQPRVARRSSAPLTNLPFVDSPIEEDVETSFPQRGNRSYASMNNTLMAQRNNKLQNRHSSTSLARTGSSGSLNNGYIPANQTIENPTSAHRKSLLQRQHSRPTRPQYTPRTSASYSPYHTDNGPNSPIENNQSIASVWRTSLRHDASTERLYDQQMEARRKELLAQKRRASAGAQAAGAEKIRRESQKDSGVRKGDFMERHREAMRKMQAGVEL